MAIEALEGTFGRVNTPAARTDAASKAQASTTDKEKKTDDKTSQADGADGDVVNISQQGRELAQATFEAKALDRTGDAEEEKTPEEVREEQTQERIKEVQKEMQEVRQEIDKIMNSDLEQEQKMLQVRALQVQLAGLQTELEQLMEPEKSKYK